MPMLNSVFMLQPNPDDTYYFCRIRSDCRYLVGGERGTVHLLTFSVGGGMLGFAEVAGPGSSHFDDRSIEIGPDGRFEILFSREKPPEYIGNWAKLDSRDDYIWIRQRSYDWGNEVDSRIAIECLDASELKRQLLPDEIARRLSKLVKLPERWSALWIDWQNVLLKKLGKNKFELNTFAEMGGVQDQFYWQTIFDLEPGYALILETELPEKRPYWNVQINDPIFNAIEFIYRQTSINGHTARIDSDGRFRAVVSKEDPGVANWLDTGGYWQGTIIGRWMACSSAPIPSLRRVPLAEVRRHLPADTVMVTEQERKEALRRRRLGAQMRRRW